MYEIAKYEGLPKDIWIEIFKWLSIADFLSISSVNKAFFGLRSERHKLYANKWFQSKLATQQYPKPHNRSRFEQGMADKGVSEIQRFLRFSLFTTERLQHPTLLRYDAQSGRFPVCAEDSSPLEKLSAKCVQSLVLNDQQFEFEKLTLGGKPLSKEQILSLRDAHDCSIFIIAAALGRTKQLRVLFDVYNNAPDGKESPNALVSEVGVLHSLVDTTNHATMVHWAAYNRHEETVKFLLYETGLTDEQREILLQKQNFQHISAHEMCAPICYG